MSSAETFTPRPSPSGAVAPPSGTTPTASSFIVPRTEERASATLPLAGAFTSQAFSTIPLGLRRITYWITYTRGAALGFPAFQMQFSNGTENAVDVVIDVASLVQDGAAPQPFADVTFWEQILFGPPPADGSPITYSLTFDVPAAATGARLLGAERGQTGSPGTASWAFTGSSSP